MKPKSEIPCKQCGKTFKRYNTVQNICLDCVLNPIKEKEKKVKAEKTKMKENLKTLSDYHKELEKEINTIVRLIDKEHNCISCGKKPKILFAGHYHSVGSKRPIRFNLLNIYGQCYSCNGEKGGLLLEYGKGLIDNFGLAHKEFCEYDLVRNYQILKLGKDEIEKAKHIAKQIIKVLTLENKTYSPKERIELRNKFNKMIGIYNNENI